MFDVFLSHNGKDKQAVRALAALLSERAIRVWFDEDQLIPGRPWQPLLEKGIKESATGAVLVGADGLGPWENEEMRALLDLAIREEKPVIPVLLPGAPQTPELPAFLSNRTWVDLREGFKEENLAKLIWGVTDKKPDLTSPICPARELKIAVTRLRHGADRLVGREKELAQLDAAWHDPKTHIVTIVAWGGVGKTALVVDWMARMAQDGWRGAEQVFDWSFYSQGTSKTTTTSADAFIAKALEFFGDPGMAHCAASPWDKGARLASLVGERRSLLILDGIEPLQYPPGPLGGKLKDNAMEALLKGLAHHNLGLCIVLTRESLADLHAFRGTTAPERELEQLSSVAGIELLQVLGVCGQSPELQELVEEVNGHALTLNLLGRYLVLAHMGDIRKRHLVQFERADAETQGGHAFKVMAAYEKWFSTNGEYGIRELTVLRLLGLFDHPASEDRIRALCARPAITGLTEALIGADQQAWAITLKRIEKCGLIFLKSVSSQLPTAENSVIDAHPLVRAYFGMRLLAESPRAWREAHARLFTYLQKTTDYRPPTLDGLQPLYEAVAHGCHANCHREAAGVFWDRIRRGSEAYSWGKLGAFGADLSALTCFFDRPWNEPFHKLPEPTRAWLLNEAAYCLQALGRLTEALEPMRVGLELRIAQENWANAAVSASNLAELDCLLGGISGAFEDARLGVQVADRSSDRRYHVSARAAVGYINYQAGQKLEAAKAFEEAERIQDKMTPNLPELYALRGFWYWDFLLGRSEAAAWRLVVHSDPQTPIHIRGKSMLIARCRGVRRRASWAMKIAERHGFGPLAFALAHLMLGRTAIYRALLDSCQSQMTESLGLSQHHVSEAMIYFRRAGDVTHIPEGLLSHSLLQSLQSESSLAQADLDEAWQIAERGPMRLFMADIHLYRVRLFGPRKAEKYPWESPQADLAAARKLIDKCGYHRRDEELADAEEAAKAW